MAEQIDMVTKIQAEAARIEEDVTYSSCGHFEAAKPWAHINLWIGIPLTLASAAAGVSAMNDMPGVATAIAFAVAAGTALMTFLAPQQRHKLHADCGNAYATLRNEVRVFRLIDCAQSPPSSELIERLKQFDTRRNELNASSPLIPERAFKRARHGIEEGQKSHRVDR